MVFTVTESGFYFIDKMIFIVLIMASFCGGVWYGNTGTKKAMVEDMPDYLLSGEKMKAFPVALSLMASYISGATIVGTPTEIYNYGTQYTLILIGVLGSCFAVVHIYLPVYFKLKVNSSYQYLEMRFGRNVRALGSILFLIDVMLFLPIVIYVPALAFNHFTGINIVVIGLIMVAITFLYRIFGGLKAIIWTDTCLTIIMLCSFILTSIAAAVVYGPVNLMMVSSDTGRLRFDNWDLSPYVRQTGWGAVIGGFLYWTCFNSCNQTMVQRYISMATIEKATWAIYIFCAGIFVVIILGAWCGLAAWTAWIDTGCDVNGNPIISDRMLPAFVIYMSMTESLYGTAGLFMAGLFGAGLSNLSVVLNACAVVCVEDILRGWLRLDLTPLMEGGLMRLLNVVLAIVAVAILVVVERLGTILGVVISLSSIASSSTCGIFTLGMCCWWVGSRGAFVGAAAGTIIAAVMVFGTQIATARGLKSPPLDFSKACPIMNMTEEEGVKKLDPETVFPLFRLSFHWIAPIGLLTTVFVGSIVGWLFDSKNTRKMDAELYSPVVWKYLPEAAINNAGVVRTTLQKELSDRAAAKKAPPPAPGVTESIKSMGQTVTGLFFKQSGFLISLLDKKPPPIDLHCDRSFTDLERQQFFFDHIETPSQSLAILVFLCGNIGFSSDDVLKFMKSEFRQL